jgi:hypothetical protein
MNFLEHIYIYIYIYIYMCVCVCVCVYTHTYNEGVTHRISKAEALHKFCQRQCVGGRYAGALKVFVIYTYSRASHTIKEAVSAIVLSPLIQTCQQARYILLR